MTSVKESVLNCKINASDDDHFINELNKLAEKNGETTYQSIIQILTEIDLEPGEAKKYWFEIISHRDYLSKTLDKQTSLITAVSDYFDSFRTSLKKYKVCKYCDKLM